MDFKQKAKIFNSHFSKQRVLINNSSKIPSIEINDIEKIIKKLHPNESRGYDMLSICMLKLCGEPIY